MKTVSTHLKTKKGRWKRKKLSKKNIEEEKGVSKWKEHRSHLKLKINEIMNKKKGKKTVTVG